MAKKSHKERVEEVEARKEEVDERIQKIKIELARIHDSSFGAEPGIRAGLEKQERELEEELEELRNERERLKEALEMLGLLEIANEYSEKARIYIPFAKELIESNKGEFIQALRLLVNAALDVREGLADEADRFSKLRARTLYRDFKNLREAGFNKRAAFRILLARIKPIDYFGIFKGIPPSIRSLKE